MDAEHARLAALIRRQAHAHGRRRFLVAIAGIPGSGKTTAARAVVRLLNSDSDSDTSPDADAAASGPAVLVPMDGFHLPRAALDRLPNREEAYVRRGAPWTFDVDRFVAFVRQLRAWADEPDTTSTTTSTSSTSPSSTSLSPTLYAPTFDHEAKDPVEAGTQITAAATIVIIEGNYLLLDEPGWREIARLVDYRVLVDADPAEARHRVARRHVAAGIERSLDDAYRRVDANDYLNGVSIREKLIPPDVVVRSVTEGSPDGR
ncbi:hypothetical protein VTN02DRAFT_6050 [Thermoascus thermophilus]